MVLQSRDYSALTFSILSLTKLLYPMEYMFPIIPLLPISMRGSEQLLLAPTPFIIGLPTSFLQCKRFSCLPDDVWMVDLDARTVDPPEGQYLSDVPNLPEPELKVLKNHLKQVRTKRSNFLHLKLSDPHFSRPWLACPSSPSRTWTRRPLRP